ncbi:hypothetical protein SAMN05660420_00259 [Desulfuromusa kysingii]|uniref:Carboxypeptidase regulatory-like domain-containing protein n=1 Tax=Desulfuromusa kysingii TaxID=37625 RepID=A0A1H3VSV4_9BACT|nr:hypothetical protein [Desulfuromusa kysingii]SDZ77761.1 hypothetical protein SAMN05660420_00259 [Desulfuromusa kysingii]
MRSFISAIVMILLFSPSVIFAHSAFMACYDNGDKTITCYGEFSDGSSAAGTPIRVIDLEKKDLLTGTIDDIGEFTFTRPQIPFTVIFDAGPGHIVKEKSTNISE